MTCVTPHATQCLALPVFTGRRKKCTLVLTDPKVSADHLSLELDDHGQPWATDTSANGTFLNGKRMNKGEKTRIKPGDALSLVVPLKASQLVAQQTPPEKLVAAFVLNPALVSQSRNSCVVSPATTVAATPLAQISTPLRSPVRMSTPRSGFTSCSPTSRACTSALGEAITPPLAHKCIDSKEHGMYDPHSKPNGTPSAGSVHESGGECSIFVAEAPQTENMVGSSSIISTHDDHAGAHLPAVADFEPTSKGRGVLATGDVEVAKGRRVDESIPHLSKRIRPSARINYFGLDIVQSHGHDGKNIPLCAPAEGSGGPRSSVITGRLGASGSDEELSSASRIAPRASLTRTSLADIFGLLQKQG